MTWNHKRIQFPFMEISAILLNCLEHSFSTEIKFPIIPKMLRTKIADLISIFVDILTLPAGLILPSDKFGNCNI